MKETTDILDAFFKSIEYSKGTLLNVSQIEQALYDLLKSHAVIDKNAAEYALVSMDEMDHKTRDFLKDAGINIDKTEFVKSNSTFTNQVKDEINRLAAEA